jgi:hypothetical protein
MYSEGLVNALKKFGVELDPNKPAEVRDQIIARVAALHPDRTGGTFADSGQESKYYDVKRLLETFERETSAASQMIPLSHVTLMMELLAKAQTPALKESVKEKIQAAEQFKTHLKRKYAFPKITSALLASLCLAVMSLLGNFKSNPMYKSVVSRLTAESRVNIIENLHHDALKMSEDWLRISEAAAEFESLRGLIDPRALKDRKEDEDYNNLVSSSLPGGVNGDDLITAGDLDLYTTDEPLFVKTFDQRATTLATEVAALQKQMVKPPPEAPHPVKLRGSESAPVSVADINYDRYVIEVNKLSKLQASTASYDQRVKSIGVSLVQTKKLILDNAETQVTWWLAIILILAASLFALFWLRERSDARWVDFISTDEGLETVLERLCTTKDVAPRTPPMFTLQELARAAGTKDVPSTFRWALGSRIDSKELGQITAQMIERLKERGVISQATRTSIQTWFEVTATVTRPVKTSPEGGGQPAPVNLPQINPTQPDKV